MSNVQTSAERTSQDLSHLIFTSGRIGRAKVLDFIPVIAGDSIDLNHTGSVRLSPLLRGLAVDARVDICSFYVPHRFIYGDQWNEFMMDGVNSSPLPTVSMTGISRVPSFLGVSALAGGVGTGWSRFPKWLYEGYRLIYNNYYKVPWQDDDNRALNALPAADLDDGFACSPLKTIWSCPLNDNTQVGEIYSASVSSNQASIDIMGLQTQYAKLFTEQEREHFMVRYRDIVESFNGSTPYDADKRPHFLMRTQFWASGYDIDGTDQSSLGQFSGRVQQAFQHKVPRFFVPEHGTIFTVALVRFPPIHQRENHFLLNNPAHTYVDIAGDPAIVGNLPPRVVPIGKFFTNGISFNMKVAESQWYRYHPNVCDHRYGELQGFPFLATLPQSMDQVLKVNSDDYDRMFESMQLGHWNIQARCNATALRSLPTARDSIMTS